ncbi:MAG: potassium channel protein [Nannocystis sp.]|nr:potassium channel protein [Nannocystis sp.]
MPRMLTTTLEDYRRARNRVYLATLVAFGVLLIGALGYWYIGELHQPGHWELHDCLYMTAITVTTVGFGEVIDVANVAGGREWTMLLLLFGVCANLYVVSSITSFFVEGSFVHLQQFRRHHRKMKDLKDHYIVCGCGSTGARVIEDLLARGESVIAIDLRPAALEQIDDKRLVQLIGDATDDAQLERAGISRAKGVVAALDDDKTNMFVVVSARQSAPRARIVTKAIQPSAISKLRRAGADAVVSPNAIGGMRMAAELVRPGLVRFLDDMVHDRSVNLWIDEATLSEQTSLIGATLGGADLRARTGALIIAIRRPDGALEQVPGPEHRFSGGQTLIAIGTRDQLAALRALAGDTAQLGAPPRR